MHFPTKRFAPLPFEDRMLVFMAWTRMEHSRDRAIKSRRYKWNLEAGMYHRTAILAIRDVKYWAEKAKEKNHV